MRFIPPGAGIFRPRRIGPQFFSLLDQSHVLIGHLSRRPPPDNFRVVQDQGLVADVADALDVVSDIDYGPALFLKLPDLADALMLEVGVPHRQDFIHQQDIRIEVDGDREGQADVHAVGVSMNRLVDELPDLGELEDGSQARLHLGAGHSQDITVEEDVFPPGEVGVEARSQFQDSGDFSVPGDGAAGWFHDPGHDLKQGTLPGAVLPQDSQRGAGGDVQADAAQCPEFPVQALLFPEERLPQAMPGFFVERVFLGNTL